MCLIMQICLVYVFIKKIKLIKILTKKALKKDNFKNRNITKDGVI